MELARRAYLLGLLPSRCQAHLNGAGLLGQLVDDASAPLAERARVLLASWPAREPRAQKELSRLGTCLAGADLELPPLPGLDAALFDFVPLLRAAVAARQASLCSPTASEDDRLAGYQLGLGHRLGCQLGDVLAALQVALVVHLLLEVATLEHGDERLLAQLDLLGDVQARGIPQLGSTLSLLHELKQQTPVTGRTLVVLTRAPGLAGRGEHRGRAAALQAVVRAVEADLPFIEDEAALLLSQL